MDDGGPWNPDMDVLLFALGGMLKGWCEIMEPEDRRWPRIGAWGLWRLWVLAGMTYWAIASHMKGMAWASVLHFVLKDFGAYQVMRMISWALTALLAKFHLIHPPGDDGNSNP